MLLLLSVADADQFEEGWVCFGTEICLIGEVSRLRVGKEVVRINNKKFGELNTVREWKNEK